MQLDDDKRKLMCQLREKAMAIESKMKEKKRAELLEQVRLILDKCVTSDQLNVSLSSQPSKNDFINKTPLTNRVRNNTSSLPNVFQQPASKSYSAPSTPSMDETTIHQLYQKFLSMKKAFNKDVSISENSIMSTDLDPYMHGSESSPSSDSSTPRAISDTDISTNLDCSTPIQSARVRRLSYTLEAPSPVLLKHLQQKASDGLDQEKSNTVKVPKLNLSNSDDSIPKESQSSFYNKANSKNNSSTKLVVPKNTPERNEKIGQRRLTNKSNSENEDLSNGNSSVKKTANISNRRVVEPLHDDSNGNNVSTRSSTKSSNVIDDFMAQQQKLMAELLEQQAKEQERLANIFKEQEQQLFIKLAQSSAQQTPTSSTKSPVCRSLNKSFDRSAKALSLFNSGRLSALVRGYLTRRLMATDRVQGIIQTIRDTTTCLKELNQGNLTILPSDVELHRRLLQQLNGAIDNFHDIFFSWDMYERMLVIARDREKRGLMMITGMSMRLRTRSRSLSSATVKRQERQLNKQDSNRSSSRPSSASTVHPRTSPSSMASSITSDRKRLSPSSISSAYSHSSAAQSNGEYNS